MERRGGEDLFICLFVPIVVLKRSYCHGEKKKRKIKKNFFHELLAFVDLNNGNAGFECEFAANIFFFFKEIFIIRLNLCAL